MDFHRILLVSDFDMTMTNLAHEIPAANVAAIERFIAGGGHFCVGTGRAKNFFAPQQALVPMNAPCVVSNGAAVYDFAAEETLYMQGFGPEIRTHVRTLFDLLDDAGRLTIESGYSNWMPQELWDRIGPDGWIPSWFREHADEAEKLPKLIPPQHAPFDEIPDPWIKLLFAGRQENVNAIAARAEELGLYGVHSLPGMYEIQPAGTSKGAASRWLANKLGCPVLVCAGDAPNDLSMLDEADFAFLPANADARLRGRGYLDCAHCDEGAIADIIRQLEAM